MTKKKILIIDDEAEIADLAKSILEKTKKFEVIVSTRAMEGINIAKAKKPDLILLDILMPDMDGSQVAEILLEDEDTKGIAIVFLSALVQKEEVAKAGGKFSGREFIAKPVTPQELISRVESILKV